METFGQCCNYFFKKHVLISTRFQILRYQCQKLQSSTTCPQIPAPETRWLINNLKRMMTLILFIGPCQAGLPALKKLTWGNCQLENISVYQQINQTSTTVNYACSYVEHIDNDSPLPTVWRNLESHVFPNVQTVTLILWPQFCCHLWQCPGPLSCVQGKLKGLCWAPLYDKWL